MNQAAIELRLKTAKEKLEMIYAQKGRTDPEVLLAGHEVDRLLNQYNRLTKRRPGEDRQSR